MAILLILLAFLYAYMVNKTVWNVVARENAEKNISSISSNIDDMEFQYIALKNAITPDLAASLGYTESDNTVFITRNDASENLSYNRN